MNTLDQFITGLITVLRDPNMKICIIGRPGLIRQITPVEYTYESPSNVGPIELDFKKTVVTSDKREYNFISSDKLFGNDNLIVLLIRRLFVANPTGLREHLPNVDPVGSMYTNNDLGSVYTHYDTTTGRNIPTV